MAATTIARKLPDWMCAMDDAAVSHKMGTWPAMTSFSAGPVPRYGTCIMSSPDSDL
ncbi:hypothetical protein D3C73_1555540 [compost metagenome]